MGYYSWKEANSCFRVVGARAVAEMMEVNRIDEQYGGSWERGKGLSGDA